MDFEILVCERFSSIGTAVAWTDDQFNVTQAQVMHNSSTTIGSFFIAHLTFYVVTGHPDIDLSVPTTTTHFLTTTAYVPTTTAYTSTSFSVVADGAVVGAVLVSVAFFLNLRCRKKFISVPYPIHPKRLLDQRPSLLPAMHLHRCPPRIRRSAPQILLFGHTWTGSLNLPWCGCRYSERRMMRQ